ncbi:hypothetical protein [Methylobacterium sp. A54F]
MRPLLLAALLALLPTASYAGCACTCVEGEMRAVCSSPVDMAPVCTRLCPSALSLGSVAAEPITLPGAPPRPIVSGPPLEDANPSADMLTRALQDYGAAQDPSAAPPQ